MESLFGWPAGRGMTTIGLPIQLLLSVVAVVVQSRLSSMDETLEEAQWILRAKPCLLKFFSDDFAIIHPPILSGLVLSFTLRLMI